MRKKRLACDIDECLGEFVSNFLKEWNIKHGTSLKPKDATEYDMVKLLGVPTEDIHKEIIQQQVDHKYLNMKPIRGAREYMNMLHNDDYQIYLVTSREVALDTITWLDKNKIPYQDLFLTRDKTSILKTLDVDVFVDDCIDNLVDAQQNGIQCILFDRPWNKDHIGIPRVDNWRECYRMIRKYGG